jgi:hypothetical protein
MLHRLISLGFALFLPVAAAASALGEKQLGSEPVGPVILTVSGNIDGIGAGQAIRLDRAMLEEIGTTKLKTSTAWTTGEAEFAFWRATCWTRWAPRGRSWWRRP